MYYICFLTKRTMKKKKSASLLEFTNLDGLLDGKKIDCGKQTSEEDDVKSLKRLLKIIRKKDTTN